MEKVKLITHNGGFHADDMFACATLELYLESHGRDYEIIRTRDDAVIKTGDYIFDIGGVYDPGKNLFDHHQRGGAGARDNGIPYASFGLVWKKFGLELCGGHEGTFQMIENNLVWMVDAHDNGYNIETYTIPNIVPEPFWSSFMIYRPTWQEEKNDIIHDDNFKLAVARAKEFLARYIVAKKSILLAEEEIKKTYENAVDKKILVFEKDYQRVNFLAALVKLPEVLFYVYPNQRGDWSVETVPISEQSFDKRKSFPEEWAGLRGKELDAVSEVTDTVFCHNSRFLCGAQTKEGAIALAEIAITK